MNLDNARTVADAILMEGYALYPFRASAPKNRYRWAFGVLAPHAWSESGGSDAWWLESQVLVATTETNRGETRLTARVRFFQIERRSLERELTPDVYVPTDRLELAGDLVFAWDEGVLREVEVSIDLEGAETTRGITVPIAFDGSREVELVPGGRVTRERSALAGWIAIDVEPIPAVRPLVRVAIRVENTTPWSEANASRERALIAAFASTHMLLGINAGDLISLLDPPAWARDAAATCVSVGTYPVLAGPPGAADVALSSPFAMCDHPQIAPESPGDLCDATEIDELLVLRTITLTDTEKREARATDPRAAAMIDRSCAVSPAQMTAMHGAARELHAGEMRAPFPVVDAPAVDLGPGARVRLRPRAGTDAQDLLYAGKIALIEGVRHDVDGRVMFAITVEGDPAAELNRWYGRFHYYGRDELEPL